MLKELNRSEKGILCLNPVHENDWLQYPKTHWESTDDKSIKLYSSEYISSVAKGELQNMNLNWDECGRKLDWTSQHFKIVVL
jgi:hypothetical protein